jgi:hypothetical protein
VHNKSKKTGTAPPKAAPTALEEARVEGVARLLLEGKKGDELARGVRALDATFRDMAVQERAQQQHFLEQQQQHQQLYAPVPSAWAPPPHRRSSSVPPSLAAMHANIALPSLPFFQPEARSDAPAQAAPRRPSSVPPFFHAPWDAAAFQPYTGFADAGLPLAADVDLPEADTSLFEPAFFGGGFGGGPAPAPLDLGFAYAPVAPHELPTPVSAALPTPDVVRVQQFARARAVRALRPPVRGAARRARARVCEPVQRRRGRRVLRRGACRRHEQVQPARLPHEHRRLRVLMPFPSRLLCLCLGLNEPLLYP